MTTKNVRKTPKINILLTLIAVVTLVSISGTYVNAEVTNLNGVTVSTQSSEEMIDLSEETTDLYEQYKPEPITELQKTNYDSIALDDSRIKKLIQGKSVEITGYSHEGNIIINPGVWDVLVHMNVDDRVVVAKINAETNKVDFVSDEPQQKLANGHAVDYYSGSQTLNGLQMRSDAPDYDHSAGTYTALLLNAVKSGSTSGELCDSSKDPGSYWMQVGYVFDSTDLDVKWTDTNQSCFAQTLTTTEPSAGQEGRFRIYIDDATDVWTGVYYNTVTGHTASVTKTVSGSSTLKTNEVNNGIFFENGNTSVTTEWDDGFAADPYADSAHYRKTTSSSWWFWDGETKSVSCPSPPPTTSQLMSGTFVGSPHKVTFDVSNIENLCEAN